MKTNNYELEYDWSKIKIKGDVEVRTEVVGRHTMQYHFLSVGGDRLARYVRRRHNGVWDAGETILDVGMKKIGEGDLLAGVLLLHAIKIKKGLNRRGREFYPG